jgi:hypothetical protein
MKNKYNKIICSLLFGALLAWGPAVLRAAEPTRNTPLEASEIDKLAKEAKTVAEHARVAFHYDLRGKQLEEKADKIEREIRQQQASPSAMATKWPAMVVNARERRAQTAMQARRAAEECYRLAQHHRTLAGGERAGE